jgi:hypothetical protein
MTAITEIRRLLPSIPRHIDRLNFLAPIACILEPAGFMQLFQELVIAHDVNGMRWCIAKATTTKFFQNMLAGEDNLNLVRLAAGETPCIEGMNLLWRHVIDTGVRIDLLDATGLYHASADVCDWLWKKAEEEELSHAGVLITADANNQYAGFQMAFGKGNLRATARAYVAATEDQQIAMKTQLSNVFSAYVEQAEVEQVARTNATVAANRNDTDANKAQSWVATEAARRERAAATDKKSTAELA